MTPKSLLRHKKAVSQPGGHGRGLVLPPRAVRRRRARHAALTDVQLKPDDQIRRVIAVLGQGLLRPARRRARRRGVDDVYILRLEQFYPWPMKSLTTELSRFKNAELVWCQEEPKNMGGWTFVDPWLELTLAQDEDQGQARPLRRPPGLGLDRRRPDEPAHEGTETLPRPKPSPDTRTSARSRDLKEPHTR